MKLKKPWKNEMFFQGEIYDYPAVPPALENDNIKFIFPLNVRNVHWRTDLLTYRSSQWSK